MARPSTPDLPTPDQQALSSIRYVARNVCCIPTTDSDKWGLFVGAQASRDCIGILSTNELVAHLRQIWRDSISEHKKADLQRNTPAIKVSTAELDNILADLTI